MPVSPALQQIGVKFHDPRIQRLQPIGPVDQWQRPFILPLGRPRPREFAQDHNVAGNERYADDQRALARTLQQALGCAGEQCRIDLPPSLRG